MFDLASCVVGIFIGIILAVIFGWICHNNRILIFAHVPVERITCRHDQYFNDPGDALAAGADISNILFLNDEDQMYYRRVPNTYCRPGPSQTVRVKPEYCLFEDEKGKKYKAKNSYFKSPYYTTVDKINGEYVDVISVRDCKPQKNNGNLKLVDGTPLLEWDQN